MSPTAKVPLTLRPGLGAVEMLKDLARQVEEKSEPGSVIPASDEATLLRRCADALEAVERGGT